MKNNKKVVVIWAGFGGLGSAIILAKTWYDVTVVEKNDKAWGRANLLEANGFKRDMWPSRYLMPDAFDKFFDSIGEKVSDHFELEKLSPSYRVYFKDEKWKDDNTYLDIYSDIDKAAETFESIEVWAGEQLRKYLKSSEYQYNIAMNKFVYKNFDSIWDFMTPQLAMEWLQLNIFTTLYNYVSRFVKDERLKKILMYPSVFLGTSPYETPALFNIMSHVDFNQWVFYPKWWIYEIIKTLQKIATANGVKFLYNSEVLKIDVENWQAKGIYIENKNPTRGLNSSNSGNLTSEEWIFTKINNIWHFESLYQKVDASLETQERDTISCIIKHWSEDKYIVANRKTWQKRLLWWWMDWENIETSGIREIIEESWYNDIKFIDSIWTNIVVKFRHQTKWANMIANNHSGIYHLNSDSKNIVDESELSKHEMKRIDFEDVMSELNAPVSKMIRNRYINYISDWNYDQIDEEFIDNFNKQNINKSENTSNIYIPADIIVSNADMHHTETKLLEPQNQSYPESYRAKKVISPSWFILYLWVDGELPQLQHHTLIFNHDRKEWFAEVFSDPKWPSDPSYYICNPSKTDPSTAPAGKENLFVLVPIAPWLECSDEILAKYSDLITCDIAKNCNIPDLASRIEFSQIFSIPQFEQYYNAYKWTALWLAHTFFQSAVRRPNNYSKKVKWLYYAGGYTTPWIGMPMCLISAMMVAERINQKSK